MAEDVDEPPDQRFLASSNMHAGDDDTVVYVKSPAVAKDQKESLLTRALKSSPEFDAYHRHPSAYDHSLSYRSYPLSNVSGVSTAELTSDCGMTSPSLSTTSSPPLPSQVTRKPDSSSKAGDSQSVADSNESTVEANLGRKRCISFACGRKTEGQQKPQSQQQQQPQPPTSQQNPTTQFAPAEPVKRKTVLTFVCPARDTKPPRERSPVKEPQRSRPRGSPAPVARKASPPEKEKFAPVSIPQPQQQQKPLSPNERRGIPTWGLGKFEESEETRFHEFASSVEEDDDWVAKAAEYTEKITMNDCMKKENAIRKLGEEAEQEALDEDDDDDEDEDDEDDSADEDDEDEDEDDEDDISTVHDLDVDDGNESDNEAGFADSDESDGGSDYGFWAPTSTTAATSPQTIDAPHPTIERRLSTASYDSPHDNDPQNWPPALTGNHLPGRRSSKTFKVRPGTPNLPDSTDFVCGTLDEDRPLEAAYKSCMEQRRLSKQVVIPQDIDPSFPTSDPEDEDDDDEEEDEEEDEVPVQDEAARGRSGGSPARKPSPRPSPPKRMVSPPPRRQGRSSPKRLRSPPPPMKFKLPSKVEQPGDDSVGILVPHPQGLNISELVQRPSVTRTKSLPRTPNPFFASLEQMPRRSTIGSQAGDSSEREMHTRGPVDIVEGLEKKRQKRKEKFWRQHCRKAAKEQTNRRPIRGKGAERMKELGLEAAERCRAYGVGEDAQLVLSV